VRRFIYAVIIILVIIYNFYVFIFGVIQQYGSFKDYNEARNRYLMESGLVLAMHYYEDSDKKLPIEKNAEFSKVPLHYRIKEMDETHISIKVWLASEKDSIEYGLKK
jgi:hypothetical protein